VEAVLQEAKSLNATEAWLTAKIPRFYEKFGFEVIDRSVAPRISNCQECPQFHNGCESEIMRIKF
jgi:N-acetylglutamate synthase-like GNAT family acetyltransferase